MKNNLFIRQLGEYFEVFLPEIHISSKDTIAAYGDSFAILFEFLREKKNMAHNLVTYKTFTAALFDEYLLWLKNERNYKPASIRQRMSAISAFLKYASRREMSAVNAYSAVIGTEIPTVARTEFPYFSLDEMKIILQLPDPNAYLGSRDLVLLSFLYETAARARELCCAKVGDIRFGSPTKVKLHGKGDKTREVPICDDVASLLKFHLKNNTGSKETPLFLSQTSEEMTTACVRSIVAKYVALAKIRNPSLFQEKNYSPHSFRHSKAVHMIESGVSLVYIRNFLGHATINSTEIYARVGQDAVTKALTNRKIPQIATNVPVANQSQCPLPDFINTARKNM